MSLGLILNLFKEFNKFSNEPARIYSIYHIFPKIILIVKRSIFHQQAYNVMLTFSALLMLCLYNANDIMSKCYYTSVISFLLNGFITLLHRILCDKWIFFYPMDIYLYIVHNHVIMMTILYLMNSCTVKLNFLL